MPILPRKRLPSPLIDQLETDLRQEFPHLKIERFDSAIRVLQDTEDGFAVGLVHAKREMLPILGSWIQYGMREEKAISLFQAGLRGNARLIEIRRKDVAYRWKVETLRNDAWCKEYKDYSAYMVFPNPFLYFWRKEERVLWNNPDRLRVK